MQLTMEVPRDALSEETRRQLARGIFGHVIDGKVVESVDGGTRPVIDPGTGLEVAVAADGTALDVDRAVSSARAAFEDGRWRQLAPMEKERRMHRLAQLLTERAQTFIELDVLDCGFLRDVAGYINSFAAEGIDYYAGWPSKIQGRVPAGPPGISTYELVEPVGVVAAIVPWNGPTAGAAMAAFALCAGNSVVLKPAEQTPMTSVVLAELALEAGIPPGVFNVVHGSGPVVGQALVEHPLVEAVFFTGSVQAGSAIQATAAKQVKRVGLELGGKSAVIAFPDADPEAVAATAMGSVWGASGQFCTCGTRLMLHRDIHDEVVERIIKGTDAMSIGNGFNPATQMGPLVSEQQLARVKGYVDVGTAEGADLALGGSIVGDGGYYIEPTVFTGVRNDMRIAQEEIFGPVMSILQFTEESEVFAMANASDYGLAAGVFTQDLGRAHRAIAALNVGTVWVNCYQLTYPSVSYGGFKSSGHGRMLGEKHLDEITRTKSAWINAG